jgi:hypothetical protein
MLHGNGHRNIAAGVADKVAGIPAKNADGLQRDRSARRIPVASSTQSNVRVAALNCARRARHDRNEMLRQFILPQFAVGFVARLAAQ